MELTEVQREADSAGRKAAVFGIFMIAAAFGFGWVVAHFGSGGPETQPVVVAAVDVAPLTQLKLEDLRVVEWPTQSMPHGTFQKPEDVVRTGEININGVLAGEPVLADRLSTPDRGLGMSQMVEPNMRAYVVRIDDHVATAEVLHPGASVDVVVTLDDPKNREAVTKVVLQNIAVLGVGDSIDIERAAPRGKDDAGSYHDDVERHRVVTLLVSLNDAETLSFAVRVGKLDLTLRNANDNNIVATKGVTFDRILGRNRDGSPAKSGDAQNGAQGSGGSAGSGTSSGGAGAGAAGSEAPARHHRPHRDAGPSIIKVTR